MAPSHFPVWICIDTHDEEVQFPVFIYKINSNLYLVEPFFGTDRQNYSIETTIKKLFVNKASIEEKLHKKLKIEVYNPSDDGAEERVNKWINEYKSKMNTSNEEPTSDDSEDPTSE
jgi:hypothetical protein